MGHNHELNGLEVAIIGMAVRFPGAKDVDTFWRNLSAGVESLDLDQEKGGVLEDKEWFDAGFFNLTPNEAQLLSPQVRIMLECCWHALEDAGYEPGVGDTAVGIYAGASSSLAWQGMALFAPETAALGNFEAGMLADANYLCTRVAYLLNLKGPTVLVQSACSTSLVAVHLACQGLLNAECDMALAGGTTVLAADEGGYFAVEGAITSPDGHCRAFDKDAAGMVRGEGAGVVLLKRLDQALPDRDHVYAVIKGTAVNNDGNRKVGFTAPSVAGQAEAIAVAMQVAEVEPETITYVEAHGTGTKLGDPVEIEGLKRAFASEKRGFCAIGSDKTNIGHLDAAAGVAGLIKTVLAMIHKEIPPSLHFRQPNPQIDFASSPFYVADRLLRWDATDLPRRAGISSFGIGGTNAHIIVEEFLQSGEEPSLPDDACRWRLIPLSARSGEGLDSMTEELAHYFQKHAELDVADAAFTLSVGRRAFDHRRFVVARDIDGVLDCLGQTGSRGPATATTPRKKPSVVFVFPGLGAQYPGMGEELYQSEPVFRREMDRCFDTLQDLFGIRLKPVLYPGHHDAGNSILRSDIVLSQLAVFCVEYSLARLLISWGLHPDAVLGYSFGELSAACVAEAWSLDDMLRLAVTRGEAMKRIPEGGMLSLPLPAIEVEASLPPELSIAIDNGPSCIVSGPKEAMELFHSAMKTKRCFPVLLPVTHAVHSAMMDAILPEIGRLAASMPGQEPAVPMVSSVTGTWLTEAEARDPGYWQRQVRERVRFTDCVRLLLEEENVVFVEVGPGRDLTALLAAHIETLPRYKAVNLMQQQEQRLSEEYYLLNKIGHLWLWGIQPDWHEFYKGRERNRISLPVYPFQRQYYWLEPDFGKLAGVGNGKPPKRFDDWFYLPAWSIAPFKTVISTPSREDDPLLLFDCPSPICGTIRDTWKQQGFSVVSVSIADEFLLEATDHVAIDPADKEHYKQLSAHLRTRGQVPRRIVHAWNLNGESWQELFSLLYLVQALTAEPLPHPVALDVLGNGFFDVSGKDPVNPGMAAAAALLRVVAQEYPGLRCRCVDVGLPGKHEPSPEDRLHPVIRELTNRRLDPVVAIRGRRRWVERLEPFPLPLPQDEDDDVPIRQGGHYLITGGLGNIGSVLARFLLETYSASVVLTGRSGVGDRMSQLERLRECGGRVRYEAVDAADGDAMERLISGIEEEWGTIHGVFHLAGLAGEEAFLPLERLDRESCLEQFHARAGGTRVLQRIFKNRPIDFCWLMSSISTLLGGLRFGAYAAANGAMEAIVHHMNGQGWDHWFCVSWDGMNGDRTLAAFQRLLPLRGIPRVLVSNLGRLDERYRQWVLLEELHAAQNDAPPADRPDVQPRPPLVTPYVAPEDHTQQELADIWRQLFGFSPIGIDDDFMELGGGSLKAITAISHIHRRMRAEIPLLEFFKRPTVRQLAEYLQQAEQSLYSDIQPAERKEYYPLSSAQKRLFILQRRDINSTAYNLPTVMVLEQEPEEEQIRAIFGRLIERHESLRTSFIILDGQPFQKIERDAPVHILSYDLSAEPLSGESVRRVLREFVRPIDISRAPAFHLALLRTGSGRGILLLDMHHIITDGVSNEILLEEFTALHTECSLPALKLQYRDYSQWQLESEASGRLRRQRDYWMSVYQTPSPLLNLPLDFPRPTVQNFDGDHVSLLFDSELASRLQRLARQEGATLYMALMAIYKVLLSLYTRQEDLVVGSPITGRRHDDLQAIIGLFVNMLAIRSFPAGAKTFLNFLSEVRGAVLGAMENQEYQYYDLVAELGLQGDRGRNPLFTAVLAMQNVAAGRGAPSQPAGERPDQVGIEVNVAKFDLLLNVVETSKGLDLNFEYASRLFKKSTITAMGRHLREVALQVLEAPDILLREIRLSTAQEVIRTGNLAEFDDEFGF